MSNRGKKRYKIQKKNQKIEYNIPVAAIQERSRFKKWLDQFNKKWKIFIGCVTLVSFCILLYNNFFKSQKKKFNEDNTYSGEIESPKVSEYTILEKTPSFKIDPPFDTLPLIKGIHIKDLKNYPILPIQIGGHVLMVPTINLFRGIDVLNPTFNGCTNYGLELIAKDDRLYVSAKFIDLQTENEIGQIYFNHWTLYKSTFLDYHDEDPEGKKFEVIDKQGNIVFQISFNSDNNFPWVTIAGYFISPTNVLVLNNLELFSVNHHHINDHNNQCISKNDSNWKTEVLIETAKIKTIFKIPI